MDRLCHLIAMENIHKTKGQTGELIITVNNEQFEQNYIEPKCEGFYCITVIDEAGKTDTVKFKVEFR